MKKIILILLFILIGTISFSADDNTLRDTLIKTLDIPTDEDRLKAFDSIVSEIKSQPQVPAEIQPEQKKPSLYSWTYKEFIDPIDDTKKIVFSKYSEDTVDGTEKAILFIRYVNGKTDVFISWGKPLKSSPEDTIPVTIRFDKEMAIQETWDIGNSYESTFCISSYDFVQKIFDKSTMAVRTTGQKGTLTVLFDITGFKQIAEKYNSQLNWIKTPIIQEATTEGIAN
jgi:hypothetical protein